MASRLYFPASGTAAVTPTSWAFPNQSANATTLPGALARGSTTLATSSTMATGTTNPTHRGAIRYVYGPLAAQTISGTVKGQIRCAESNAGANATLGLAIKIIAPNGDDRNTLLAYTAADTFTDGSAPEMATTLTNRSFRDASENTSISLTSQEAQAGDYLVVEIGFRSATGTTRNITYRYGESSSTELAEDETTTSDYTPWIEFSQTLVFAARPGVGTVALSGLAPALALVLGIGAGAIQFTGAAPTVSVTDATVELRQGTTVVATRAIAGSLTTALQTLSYALTVDERAAISDWTALRVYLRATGRQLEVSWIQLETPAAGATPGTYTPGVGAVQVVGLAPPLAHGIGPPVGAVTITGLAPVVAVGRTPDTASVQLTGLAPGVGAGRSPATASVTLAGQTPALVSGVVPGTAAVQLAGFAPTLGAQILRTPDPATVVAVGLAPALAQTLVPGSAALQVTGLAPTAQLTSPNAVTPGVGTVTLEGAAPALTLTVAVATATVTITTAAPTRTVGTATETFETASGWLVDTETSGTGSTVARSSDFARAGTYSAKCFTTNSSAKAQVCDTLSSTWDPGVPTTEPGEYLWQHAYVYVPSATANALTGSEYLDLGAFYATGSSNRGWFLRLKANAGLAVSGAYLAAQYEFTLYDTLPLDQWVELEIGLWSLRGMECAGRSFIVFVNGTPYGWFRLGEESTDIDRVALGIVATNSTDDLAVYVDDWRVTVTGQDDPTGTDNRRTATSSTTNFRSQSGQHLDFQYGTWKDIGSTYLDATHGLGGARTQVGPNTDLQRANLDDSGWAEIELDWVGGTRPSYPPSGGDLVLGYYYAAMVAFKKYFPQEQNLEIVFLYDYASSGTTQLAYESWGESTNPTVYATWQIPAATDGGNRQPEPGDKIRVHWERSGSNLHVWAAYYDASTQTWYWNVVDDTRAMTASNGVNWLDGIHNSVSVTTETTKYSVRQLQYGTLATAPARSIIPGAGAIQFTGLAPVLRTGLGAAPGAGTVTLAGAAPSVGQRLVPDVGAVQVVGLAPTAQVTSPSAITPGLGTIALQGAAPALVAAVSPEAGVVQVTGAAPTLALTVAPGQADLQIVGLAPTATVTSPGQAAPPTGTITLEGVAPALALKMTTGVGTVQVVGLAPTSGATIPRTPDAGTVRLVGVAPDARPTIVPAVATVQVAGLAPTLQHTVTPGTGTLRVVGQAPTQAPGIVLTPDLGTLTITGLAPTLTLSVAPAAGALVLAGQAPTMTAQAIDYVSATVTSRTPTATVTGRTPSATVAVVT